MNITTNNIGNYSINRFRPKVNNSQPAAVSKEPNLEANVDKTEKEFFSNLYPKQRSEIINYHYYGSNGQMSGVAIGKNIDRKM